MTGPRLPLLLGWILAASSLSLGGLSVKDTVVYGIPSLRMMEGKGWNGNLKIDSERGQLRATLEGMPDSVLVVFDRNPFARMGGLTRPMRFPPRVTKSRLVLPKETALALLHRMGVGRAAADKVDLVGARKKIADTSVDARKPSRPMVAPMPPRADTPEVADRRVDTPSSPVVDTPASPDLDTPSVPDAVSAPAVRTPEAPSADTVAIPQTPATPEVTGTEDAEPPAAASRKGVFTVVVDAGHGGKDPGARGRKADGTTVLEKMATLQVALKLRDVLAGHKGIKVVMTRDKDVFVELSGRTRIANAAKGDLFISLHCNSLPAGSKRRDEVDGFMVYLLREAMDERDKAIERRENDAINYETGEHQTKEALSPVEWMLLDHQLNLYTKESERFAGLVVRRLQSEGPVAKERTGASQAGFFVLVGALMPSVLIEMGYVSSPADAEALTDSARQKKIAEAIAEAIEQFRSGKR
ncbi:MAG TPA: N-acetylmuramoyl-L-alanine amidase [Fibrobacteria bacterium]|nr:N-acetylmuramoyl-L-alanine amidase [Fibrobacteria bacterium]